jgi:hypothetical protein
VFQMHVASFCLKCFICFIRMLQAFRSGCCIYFTRIYRKSMFEMFQPFQSYVAISVFMLQVVSVLSGCCICFTHMFQVYVLNVSSALDVYCIQVFHILEVESHGARPER